MLITLCKQFYKCLTTFQMVEKKKNYIMRNYALSFQKMLMIVLQEQFDFQDGENSISLTLLHFYTAFHKNLLYQS